MSVYFYIGLAFFLVVVLYGLTLILKFSWKKKLTEADKKQYNKLLNKIETEKSDKQKIIDYDKLYHKILQSLWYKWDFWSILKTTPNEIKDINKIWELHKLRNDLVHDFNVYSKDVLKKASKDYKKELDRILK